MQDFYTNVVGFGAGGQYLPYFRMSDVRVYHAKSITLSRGLIRGKKHE